MTTGMRAANLKRNMTTTTSLEVRRPANGSFSGNDADDTLEKQPSRAICAESCDDAIDDTLEKQPNRAICDESCDVNLRIGSRTNLQTELCLETACEENNINRMPRVPKFGPRIAKSALCSDIPAVIMDPGNLTSSQCSFLLSSLRRFGFTLSYD